MRRPFGLDLFPCRFPQKYFQNVANFKPPYNDRKLSTIHHTITTASPQKHHAKRTLFLKPPSKTPAKTTKMPLSRLSKKNLKKQV
jgi:hypothetical protein